MKNQHFSWGRFLISIVVVALVGGSIYYYYQGYWEKRSVVKAVEAYNRALSEALESSSAEPLALYATQTELGRIQSCLSFSSSEGKFMRSSLEKINFTEIKIEREKAEVNTEEEWTYQYIDAKTKKPLGNQEKVKYQTKYKLLRINGRWLVSEVEVVENEGKSLRNAGKKR
jgi:hypothetical protein